MKKNDLINLEIIDTTLDGNGVGKHDGLTVFVNSAVTGDVVTAHILKIKTNYAFAKIKSILKPSEHRVEVNCSAYPKCGGCRFRHICYKKELEIKENNVKNNLKRIGNVEPLHEPIFALSPDGYRNKAQYPIRKENGQIKIGFFAGHSHRVIDCPDCTLQPPEFSEAIAFFKEFLEKYNISVYDEEQNTGLVRHIYLRKAVVTNEIMVTVVINGYDIPFIDEMIASFKKVFGSDLKSLVLNINCQKTNVIMGEECKVLFGSDHITDILCGVKVRISPLSFYQVNHDVAEELYYKAAEYAQPQDKFVLDLYCGAGTIGLSMAKKAKRIIGVEIVPEAVEDACFNAKQNGFENTEFICGDASYAAEELNSRGIKPDVVILDPPRKGCDPELISIIAEDFAPERVVYVSCDPATLARDCKLFKEQGYETEKCTPFDMFPRTGHVECVVKLVRNNDKKVK